MIQLQNIFLAFGGHTVLDSITWSIREKRRIGLVGPNGAGKTTLLRLISGEQKADGGTITYGGWRVGYLKQDTQEIAADRTVLEEALEAFAGIQELQAKEKVLLAQMENYEDHSDDAYARIMDDFAHVHEQLAAREAHLIVPRTESVLSGLGFAADDMHRPLKTFSGGWRMRVALARLLLDQPEVLLLDEPTNHLDIDSIAWLEEYLRTYPGTVVLVSHDRRFLDRMTNWTVEIMQGRLTEYAGNYDFYLQERQIRREHHRAAWENQQKMIQDTERFIERFRAKATKATQVQSRVKALERLERIPELPPDEAQISFRFPKAPRSGKVVLELSRFSKTYPSEFGDIKVFEDADPVHIERGQKIALIGRNGAGKSTLARMLLGTEPFEGTRKEGHNVHMQHFAQHQAESLNPDHTALDALREVAYERSETELRTILGAFLFRGAEVEKPIRVLSGGERSRIALARTLTSPANLLVLDEPTNHLDLQSIQVLIEALTQYTGTFVLISHDRHFLDAVATSVWRVEDGHLFQYDGTYAEYEWKQQAVEEEEKAVEKHRQQQEKARRAENRAENQREKQADNRKEEARADEQKRAADGPVASEFSVLNDYQLNRKHSALEADILTLETEKESMEARLADPEIFANPDEGKKLMADYEALQQKLSANYAQWELMAEELTSRS